MLSRNQSLSVKALGALFAAVLVAGCGGGDDPTAEAAAPAQAGAPAPAPAPATHAPADKYPGHWVLSCSQSGAVFESESVTIARASDTELTGQIVLRTYNSAGCTGTPAKTETSVVAARIDGQTTLARGGQPQVFDQVTVAVTGEGTVKWLMTVLSDGRMLIDFDDNNASSSSTVYPANPNDGTSIYVKQ